MAIWLQIVLFATGFAVSIGLGQFVVERLVRHFQNLGGVNKRGNEVRELTDDERACTKKFGYIERAAITIIGIYDLQAAGVFVLTWMGLKLACYWNRPGRIRPRKDNENEIEAAEAEEIIRRVARGGLTALIGSLISALFGIAGALIATGKWQWLIH